MFNQILNKIKEFDTIIIHRHSKPDGDALGSQIGLKELIKSNFPNKKVYAVGDTNARFLFIGEMDEIEDECYNGALCFILDCGTLKLVSDDRYTKANYLIKMDHHIPQSEYGDICYVDTSRESCAGIIAQFAIEENLVITPSCANNLFTGMITDSGRFRYSSTNSKTFDIASKLLSYGVDTEYIYSKIYSDKLANVKLRAKLTEKFIVLDSGVAFLINTYEDVLSYGLPVNDVSRGMVGIMSGIEEIIVWANFTEDENKDIYVELRSSCKNVNSVAVKYGGGGHLQASGCALKSMDEVYRLIKDLERIARGEECLV